MSRAKLRVSPATQQAAIVGEPFDGERQAIDPTEPMFDGSHHQVTHVPASDAARSGEEAHSFTITAVQCEGNPHLLTVVTANLEAIGAPTPIAFIHGDATRWRVKRFLEDLGLKCLLAEQPVQLANVVVQGSSPVAVRSSPRVSAF
jgi:hypothetical protein